MNDMPLVTGNATTDMYADDSTIHTKAKTIDELESKLNSETHQEILATRSQNTILQHKHTIPF